jgi:hypothetical protein
MQTQLVERYLKDNDCKHGLYLIGWFPLKLWDEADYRRRQVQFREIDDLTGYVERQAVSLSSGVNIAAKILNFSYRRPKLRLRKRSKAK